jgi:hypothetical protein
MDNTRRRLSTFCGWFGAKLLSVLPATDPEDHFEVTVMAIRNNLKPKLVLAAKSLHMTINLR